MLVEIDLIIGLLLVFNNGLIIEFMSNTSCNIPVNSQYEWTWPISFTSTGYSYVMLSNKTGGIFSTLNRTKTSNTCWYTGSASCTRFQVICIGY